MENYEFDEWAFIEHWHPDYNCDYIAWIGDCDQLLSGDYDPDGVAAQSEYATWPKEEIEEERNRLMAVVLRQAMEHFIEENYPNKSLCEE